jgi:hypothetical protein
LKWSVFYCPQERLHVFRPTIIKISRSEGTRGVRRDNQTWLALQVLNGQKLSKKTTFFCGSGFDKIIYKIAFQYST